MLLKNSKISSYIRWGLVMVGVYFVFQVLLGAYAVIAGGSFADLIWFFAGDLTRDSEDRTNFLLLGTGGEGHEGADLTDTFMVASYSHTYGTLALFSIPRDFYARLADGTGMRINQVYEYEKLRLGDSEVALRTVAEAASSIVDLPIHYYLKLDFLGFVDLVDAIGGVKVLVESEIDDPYYPCPNMVDYCPFQVSEGVHQFTGGEALKFARSRKTTSDFDRAARQQKILEAIREKAFDLDILTSPSKLKDIYGVLKDNMETNLRLRELIRLGNLADSFDRRNIARVVLSDEPNLTGGLLYSPNREDYNGAAVLVPEGDDYRRIHALARVFFSYPRIFIDQLPIEVLNSTGRPNLARDVAYYLNRYGLETFGGNYPGETLSETMVYYYADAGSSVSRSLFEKSSKSGYSRLASGTAEILAVLPDFLEAKTVPGSMLLKKRGFALTIILGEDWSKDKMRF